MEPEIKTGRERETLGNEALKAIPKFGPQPSGSKMVSSFALLVHFSMSSGTHKPFSPLGRSVRSNKFGEAFLRSRSLQLIFKKKMALPKKVND